MSARLIRLTAGILALVAVVARPARAQSALSGDTIRISRAAGPIIIDGDLSGDGWRGATRVDKWYETQPGDNTEPKVRNVGYLTCDDASSTRRFPRSRVVCLTSNYTLCIRS